jgi:hypothetical protein
VTIPSGFPSTVTRGIVVPNDIFADVQYSQQLVLMFDSLLAYSINRFSLDQDTQKQATADRDFLRAEGVVRTAGVEVPIRLSFGPGQVWSPNADDDLTIPLLGLPKLPPDAFASDADRVVYQISQVVRFGGKPATACLSGAYRSFARGTPDTSPYFELVLAELPLPPVNMPWGDLLAFKRDPAVGSHLAALRKWIAALARQQFSPEEATEQLHDLLSKYRQAMKAASRQYQNAVMKAVVTTGLASLVGPVPAAAAAAHGLFDVRAQYLKLEYSATAGPGAEVAYVARSQDFLLRR